MKAEHQTNCSPLPESCSLCPNSHNTTLKKGENHYINSSVVKGEHCLAGTPFQSREWLNTMTSGGLKMGLLATQDRWSCHFSAVNLGKTLLLTTLRSPGHAEALISMCWIISFGVMQAKKLSVRIYRILKSKILSRTLQLHWKMPPVLLHAMSRRGVQCCVAEGGGLFEQNMWIIPQDISAIPQNYHRQRDLCARWSRSF